MNFVEGVCVRVRRTLRSTRQSVSNHPYVWTFVGVTGLTVASTAFVGWRLLRFTADVRESQSLLRRKHAFFQNSQRNCDDTIASLLRSINKGIVDKVVVVSTQTLRQLPKQEKIAAWNGIKQASFVRTIAGIYSVCLTTLMLRIQLNILGKYLFLDSCINKDKYKTNPSIPHSTQTQFLAMGEYLMTVGVEVLIDRTTKAAHKVLESWPLQRNCEEGDLNEILLCFREEIEGCQIRDQHSTQGRTNEPEQRVTEILDNETDGVAYPPPSSLSSSSPSSPSSPSSDLPSSSPSPPFSFVDILLPPEEKGDSLEDQLSLLINETRNVLEAPAMSLALQHLLDESFTLLGDRLRASSHEHTKLPIIKVAPLVAKELDVVFQQEGNPYLLSCCRSKALQEYCFSVFSEDMDTHLFPNQ